VKKQLFLSGIVLLAGLFLREIALAGSNKVTSSPESSQPILQLRDPLLSNFLLPLPPLLLPDLLFPPYNFSTFNSQRLDQELELYYQYLQKNGKPDVMIIGSSRSLQGINPTALRDAMAAKGYRGLKVYNFGINGATAQVINLVLQEVLTPEQLPRILVWGDGSRAFNSGRLDVTYNGIIASEGYRRLALGDRPIPNRVLSPRQVASTKAIADQPNPAPDLDRYGFNALTARYDPDTYYQRFPSVLGQYDSNYQNFQLWGNQSDATKAIADFTRAQDIALVFVSLPLTDDYVADAVRRNYEQRFQQHMGQLAKQKNFLFIDYHQQPELLKNEYFVDPSHINQEGAKAVAAQLAADARMPWKILRRP
jgi:lysophospholipase L1-like esterase